MVAHRMSSPPRSSSPQHPKPLSVQHPPQQHAAQYQSHSFHRKSKSNPQIPSLVESWLRKTYVPCENGIIPKTRMYEAYEAFCDATKLRPSPPNTFGKILLKVHPYVQTRRMGPHGAQVPCYGGIAARHSSAPSSDSEGYSHSPVAYYHHGKPPRQLKAKNERKKKEKEATPSPSSSSTFAVPASIKVEKEEKEKENEKEKESEKEREREAEIEEDTEIYISWQYSEIMEEGDESGSSGGHLRADLMALDIPSPRSSFSSSSYSSPMVVSTPPLVSMSSASLLTTTTMTTTTTTTTTTRNTATTATPPGTTTSTTPATSSLFDDLWALYNFSPRRSAVDDEDLTVVAWESGIEWEPEEEDEEDL